jgi:hypothetical protein
MFEDEAAMISDDLGRFLLRGRTRMIYTAQRKAQIYHQGDGNCSFCHQVENLKHFLNYFMNRGFGMTKKHINIERILAQANHIHLGQNIIKSFADNYVNWKKKSNYHNKFRKSNKKLRMK